MLFLELKNIPFKMVSNLNKLKNKMWYPVQDMNVQMGPGQSRWMKPDDV